MRTSLDVATEWIRGFATTYLPNDGKFAYSATAMRDRDISLVDLLCLFRTACVVSVAMNDGSDGQKGVWTVEGFDSDDRPMQAVVRVETEAMAVDVLDAARIVTTMRASNGAE